MLPLHVNRIRAGTYVGTVSLTPDAADKGKVSLTLTAKDFWLLAELALLGGIVMALLVQRWNGVGGAQRRLLQRVVDITDRKAKGVQALQAAAAKGGTPRRWGAFDIRDSDLTASQRSLESEIRDRTQGALIQIDQKVVDELNTKIAALETQVDAFEALAKIAQTVDAVLAAIAEPAGGLPPLRGSDIRRQEPALVPEANRLLEGDTLTVAEFADRVKDLTTMATTLTKLHGEEHELSIYWRQATELEDDLPDEQKALAQSLKQKLVGIRHWLWSGETPDEIDESSSLADARNTIAELWSKLPERERRLRRELHLEMEELEAGIRVPAELEIIRPMATRRHLPQPPDVLARAEMTAGEVERVIKGAKNRQWAVLAISAVVAVLSGLTLLYVDKSWGTWWDYLAAGAWGLGTQAAVLSLAGAIDGLGPLGALRHGIGAHSKAPAEA